MLVPSQRHSPARGDARSDRELLQNYLDDIFDTRVLDPNEQLDLLRQMETA